MSEEDYKLRNLEKQCWEEMRFNHIKIEGQVNIEEQNNMEDNEKRVNEEILKDIIERDIETIMRLKLNDEKGKMKQKKSTISEPKKKGSCTMF